MAIMLLLAACHKTAPQQPRRLSDQPKVDTEMLALMDLNEQMASAGDREVVEWVKARPEQWTKLDGGAWYLRQSRQTSVSRQEGDKITVWMQVRTLDGQLICDVHSDYLLGKCELPPAVDEAIQETGWSRLQMVCPWYTAFGPHGNDQVDGYENVCIDVEIK